MTPTQEAADIRAICRLAGLRVDTIDFDSEGDCYTVAIYPVPDDWGSERLTSLLLPEGDWTVYAGRWSENSYWLETLEFKRLVKGRNAR